MASQISQDKNMLKVQNVWISLKILGVQKH